jgi:hypothetical protein
MTGCNELRNKLKADGTGGARNKNSHGVILTFVAPERQVVGANVKSSGECGGSGKLCGVKLRSWPSRMITGRFGDRDLMGRPTKRRAIGAPQISHNERLSAR